MRQRERKQLRAKVNDYKMYSLVLLAIGALFYLGVILPGALEAGKKPLILIAIAAFLAASIYFLRRSASCRRMLEDEDEMSL
ncbi:YrhC family protein [Anoxybacillus sp. PDR2]|uniref:YrhC family protein n=1 Tax=Anoxybacillaceae TaxID=3120669 RepID=UPI001317C268|nr:YrhC family protein [Anoxybacillus sp. PDR2]QHC04856.1 hypothetical protein GRQ40_13465 [Anoxybacillus sp. PDR2]